MLRKCLPVLAGLILAGAAFAVDLDARHTVRPGEGIGVVKLGMTVPQVHDAMKEWGAVPILTGASGGPGAWPDKKSGTLIEGYQTDPLGRGRYGNIMKVFYDTKKYRVVQVAVQSVAYVTTKGASRRFSSAEWRRTHTSLRALPVEESWGGNIRAYDSPTLGLAVTFAILANKRESSTAQEVIVHLPGTTVLFESPRRPDASPAPSENTRTSTPGNAPNNGTPPANTPPSEPSEPAVPRAEPSAEEN